MEQSLEPGSQTFEQALYELYRSGQITLNDALVNADSATNLQWLIDNAASARRRLPAAPPNPSARATAAGD